MKPGSDLNIRHSHEPKLDVNCISAVPTALDRIPSRHDQPCRSPQSLHWLIVNSRRGGKEPGAKSAERVGDTGQPQARLKAIKFEEFRKWK